MTIKFVDLGRQYDEIKPEVLASVENVFSTGAFIMGPDLRAFEEEFASYCGTRFAVGVGSGTAALELALRALGIGPGDEVVVPANTYIATAIAISQTGAEPVLVDVDERTFNIDPSLIEAAITPRTKAILPVHLFGRLADMQAIRRVADRHGLAVLEDACQAHGARTCDGRAGSFGDAAAFSFYPGKNLGAFGDGGAIATNDPSLYEHLVRLRDFGQARKYHHEEKAGNSRLDTVQAAILRVKLRKLDEWNQQRRDAARLYAQLFENSPVRAPEMAPGESSVYHLYVVRLDDREAVMRSLQEHDVQFGIHYPIPIHLQNAYAELAHLKGSLPVTERLAGEILSLPMFPGMREDEIRIVASVVLEACKVAA